MCPYRCSSPPKLDTVMDSVCRPNHLLGRLTAGRAYTDDRPGGSHLHKGKRGRCGLRWSCACRSAYNISPSLLHDATPQATTHERFATRVATRRLCVQWRL